MPYSAKKLPNGHYEVVKKDTGAMVGETHQKGKAALKRYFAALHANAMNNEGK
jgi:hypothetical protein